MSKKSQNFDAEIPHASIAAALRDAALRMLSELSGAAKDAGNEPLMYAANRAWRELDDQRRGGLN